MSHAIPIAFCFDANYAPYAAVATSSLIHHARSKLHVYWLVPASDVGAAQALRSGLACGDAVVEVVGVSEGRFAQWKETHHISRGAYLRLLIPELVNQPKAIYLDCDTLVLSDLTELYETPMNGCLFAGVIDPVGGQSSRVPRDSGDAYINSGVLLMDLDGLRHGHFLACAEAIYAQHRDTITWLDQCIINKYAEGRKQLLDPRWNRQLFSQSTDLAQWQGLVENGSSAVLHFVGGIKPWHAWCHPEIAAFWWRYAHRLGIPGLAPQPITRVEHALALADVLQLVERADEANAIRHNVLSRAAPREA